MNKKQREHWQRLSPNHRRILVSHRRDDFEREEHARSTTRRALEFAFGPTQWEATIAVLAEGEAESRELLRVGADAPDDNAFTLDDVATYLGLSRERTRQIETKALRKLAHNGVVEALLLQYLDGTVPDPSMRPYIRRLLAGEIGVWSDTKVRTIKMGPVMSTAAEIDAALERAREAT